MKNYQARDKKLNKRKYGMRVSGSSVKLLHSIILKKSILAKENIQNNSAKLESKNINIKRKKQNTHYSTH